MPKRGRSGAQAVAGPVLLDTHVWIWYLDGRAREFSPSVRRFMQAVEKAHFFWVSEMSVWEAANKAAKGRLHLSPTAAIWMDRATQLPGYRFSLPDRATYLLSTRLPELEPTHPSDRVDRILIATAMLQDIPLLTADRGILDYAHAYRHLRAIDARKASRIGDHPST